MGEHLLTAERKPLASLPKMEHRKKEKGKKVERFLVIDALLTGTSEGRERRERDPALFSRCLEGCGPTPYVHRDT